MPTFTTSDGVHLHYVDRGTGRPIVFVAGWAMDGSWWRHQSELARRFRTVILDPRSQGRSEKVVRGLRLARGAKDLYEFLDHVELDDVSLVAWSRSSSVALAYWELFGAHRLGRFIFIGITPSMSRRPDWEWGYHTPPSEFQVELLAHQDRVIREIIRSLFHVPPTEPLLEELAQGTLRTPAEAGARMLDDHGVIDWRDMLPTISIPTLVCVGRYDQNAPLGAAVHVSQSVQNGELVVFEESAHAPFMEEPKKFNSALERFIDRHPRSTLAGKR